MTPLVALEGEEEGAVNYGRQISADGCLTQQKYSASALVPPCSCLLEQRLVPHHFASLEVDNLTDANVGVEQIRVRPRDLDA
jgi:hypothetical protein